MDITQSYTTVAMSTRQQEVESASEKVLIEGFLRNKDVAPWFRGTSIFHLHGANQLFNAIRDDAEQRTSHRVRNCLNMIGLEPIAPSKDLKFLMRLSRGNDLAFLWFLMEMHYKNSGPDAYSVNEQLICSAICHLDMITTLRELDKILPSGRESATATKTARQQRQGLKETFTEANKKKVKPMYILPYFEKMGRPKAFGKSLTIDIPNFKVNFNMYAGYADPNYVVHNESNRWYAEYEFNPGRRVTYGVIRNAIASIFENFEAAQLKVNTVTALCEYHRTLKEIEENYKHELRVGMRDKCLKKCFVSRAEQRKHRLRRIKESLHNAIEQQTALARKELTLKTLTSDCDIVDVIVGEEYDECCRAPTKTRDVGDTSTTKSPPPTPFEQRNRGIGDFVENEFSKIVPDNLKQANIDAVHSDLLMTGESPSQISGFASKYLKNYDYGHVADTPKSSQTFFHAPTDHKPYQFDYRKIFLHRNENAKENNRVKKAFLDALDKDISTLNELLEVESKLGVAASECAAKTWTTKLSKYGEDMNVPEGVQPRWPLKQYPAVGKYDAEDKTLMDKMLADAFEYLRRDPKFVLAQLPEAHKLPMLREWISRRFGKVYSPKDRGLSYRYSLKIFHALDRMSFDFPTPTAAQLGKNQFVSYSCKHYLAKKVKHIKDRFYRRLDNAIMEQSRTYWFAMRGYLCSGAGPPRETFFAYMPSRLRDIQRFRLWRSSEHRPDKKAWDKRLLAKKRQ